MDRQLDIDEPLGQYYENCDGQYTHGQTAGTRATMVSILMDRHSIQSKALDNILTLSNKL